MHKGLTPLAPVVCDKMMRHKANVWFIEQEGKGELQGGFEATQRRFREGSEGAVEATTLGIENQVRLKAQL